MQSSLNRYLSRILRPAASCILLLVLSACAAPATPTVSPVPLGPTVVLPTLLPSPSPAPTVTPRPVPTVYPLSGLPADPEYAQWPPLVVIVPSDAAPYGLSQASVVYTAAVEGGIPRSLAIFEQVEADQIGPVRSARHYFADWACPYGPLMAYWGGSPQALTRLGTSDCIRTLDGQTYGRGYFFHQEDPVVPWNSEFTSSKLLYGYLQNWNIARSVDFQGYLHEPCAADELPLTHTLTIPFAIPVQYTFEPAQASYRRDLGGVPYLDRLTDEPIRARNVAVIFVPQAPIPGDPEGRLDFQTSGEGAALIFTCGEQVAGRWVKESPTAELRLLDGQGQEVVLAPGSLWIEVLAPGQEVSFE